MNERDNIIKKVGCESKAKHIMFEIILSYILLLDNTMSGRG